MGIRRVIVAALAGASVLAAGAEGTALADPVPRPVLKPLPPRAQAGSAAKAHVQDGQHPRRVRHHRPRTVVRCQSDGTEQIDEIDSDDDGPRHYVSPDAPGPAGNCPGARQALAIADLLDGGTRRAVRHSRRIPVRAVRPAR